MVDSRKAAYLRVDDVPILLGSCGQPSTDLRPHNRSCRLAAFHGAQESRNQGQIILQQLQLYSRPLQKTLGPEPALNDMISESSSKSTALRSNVADSEEALCLSLSLSGWSLSLARFLLALSTDAWVGRGARSAEMCDEITRGKAARKFSTKIQHENIALQFHRTSCGSARKCLDYPRLDLSKSVKTTRARFLDYAGRSSSCSMAESSHISSIYSIYDEK